VISSFSARRQVVSFNAGNDLIGKIQLRQLPCRKVDADADLVVGDAMVAPCLEAPAALVEHLHPRS
jgi:hypothetical protein